MATVTFSGSIDGTFAATGGIGVASDVEQSVIAMSYTLTARLAVAVPPPVQPEITRRARPGVYLAMPTPVIVNGKPTVPRFQGTVRPTASVILGTGHTRAYPDPDPIWGGSAWSVPPPQVDGYTQFMRWTARDLPDPAGFPGGVYYLGAATSRDGTGTIAAAARQWAAAAGSTISPSWNSTYPFKPQVKNHVHYGRDGSLYTETAGVRFQPHAVSHMWNDFGTILTPPFTYLIVCVVLSVPSGKWNWVFDSGQDQTGAFSQAQKDSWYAHGVGGDSAVSENLGYRTALAVGRTQAHMWNDQRPTTRYANSPFILSSRPHMLTYVANGGSSFLDVRSTGQHSVRTAHLSNHGAQRLMLLGRRNGVISARYGASMVVFEMRAWDKALTAAELDRQYAQLSSTWKFSAYR